MDRQFYIGLVDIVQYFVGTKWCGLGTDAESYDDLAGGSYREVDKCCRTHDHCDKIIAPFQAKYGTFNWNLFTMY